MIQLIKILLFTFTLPLIFVSKASAQSYITYNHDETKMKQITVMEIGSGSLTPEFYYTIFHNSYKKSAATKNKMSFRTLAGLSSYLQVDDADSIKTSLVKRAEVEALNVADRQIDVAWLAEGSKVTNKMSDFQKNINRIVSAGGNASDKDRWTQYYNMFQCAVKATQDAYMPNSERKKEYLAIYNDLSKQNELLVAFIVRLNNRTRTAELLSATNTIADRRREIATVAHNRWREAGWKTYVKNEGNSGDAAAGTEDGNTAREE